MSAFDNSDYESNRTNLLSLLPEVLKSDTNKSLFETLFNRFLTKTETKLISGYVGPGSTTASGKRRIQENSNIPKEYANRQAFQLQPLMYSKIGSIEHIQSWVDTLNELESLGIDTNKFNEWCQLLKFNWVPPVDLDKLINYQNYYWFDPLDANSTPQYITVKNRAATASSKLNFIQNLIGQYGNNFRILGITSPNILKIRFNYTELFKPGLTLHIKHTALSVIPEFEAFVVNVVSSSFDSETNLTTIIIEEVVSISIKDSSLTLDVLLATNQQELNCLSTGVVGWDSNGWDLNGWAGSCDNELVSKELTQWIDQNKWVHKNDLANFASARLAKYPIIEFDNNLELNEWNFTNSRWKYRQEFDGLFSLIETNPTIFELKPFEVDITSDLDITGPYIRFGWEYGDLTKLLVPGFQITGFGSNGTVFIGYITIISSEYKAAAPGEIYQTYIKISVSDKDLMISSNMDLMSPTKTSFGHVWRGYHVHWLYDGIEDSVPTLKKIENHFLNNFGALIDTANYSYKINKFAQAFTTISVMNTFILDSSLQTTSLVDNSDIRVYVSGTRIYGDYSEQTALDLGIGTDNIFVVGIKFNFNIQSAKSIVIEVGASSLSELGLSSMKVRTIVSDDEFRQAKQLGKELELVSLIEYRKSEQSKIALNQYPIFDIYDIYGNSAGVANQIFGYKESQESSYLSDIGLRVERNSDSKNFMFEQFLLGPSDETLAYRDYSQPNSEFWYDSITRIVKHWNGKTWSNFVKQGNNYATIKISKFTPIDKFDGMLWYCVETGKLTRFEQVGLNFTEIFVISSISSTFDSTLQTIWKKGTNNEKYIPKYVDSTKIEVPISSDIGQWEIPDPMYFNPIHDNRRNISLTQISDHLNSIIQVQYVHPSFDGNPSDYFHLLYPNEINYGIGGKIKEYLGGFDTFLSSMFIDSVNIPELINFEYTQHIAAVRKIKTIFSESLFNNLPIFDPLNTVAYKTSLINSVINTFEANTYQASIYGDSTTFNDKTNYGIKYFPTSITFIGASQKVSPYFIQDKTLNINKIIGHDGQVLSGDLDQLLISDIIKSLLLIEDTQVQSESIGRSSTLEPPANFIQFQSMFSPTLRPNVFWYNNVTRILYRLAISIVGNTIPATIYQTGTLWFDTTPGIETLKIKSGLTWNPVFPLGSGKFYDFSLSSISGWEVIDLDKLYMEVQLEVETRLFNQSPDIELKIDIESIKMTQEYKDKESEKFFKFSHLILVNTPLANTLYEPSNALTWNYKYSVPIIPPSLVSFISGGCWQDLYEKNFGTAYPHLEPWKLQSYKVKPDWWDSEYLNDDIVVYGTRRWKHLTDIGMWTNVRSGIIPVGRLLPDGITLSSGLIGETKTWNYVPVNTTDSLDTLGGQPDNLLPPYISGPINNYARSIYSNMGEIIKNGLDYIYGDQGTNEWSWKHSLKFNYEVLQIIYEINPINTIYKLFGFDTSIINNLEFDTRTKKVPTHGRTKFHGEILPGGSQYLVNGLNQWMINFNRYSGYDSGFSDFSQKWTSWQVPLAYQFDSFLDKTSFEIQHDNLDITDVDYVITSKKSPGVRSERTDAISVRVLKMPPTITRYDNQAEWKFSVSTFSEAGDSLEYYNVLKYPVYINPVTNTLMLYTYQIVLIDLLNNTISVPGNQVKIFTPGTSVTILQSSLNNGTYEVVSSTIDPQNEYTVIKVSQPLTSVINDGIIKAQVRAMNIKPTITSYSFDSYMTNTKSIYYPFELGSELYISSTGLLPKVIEDDTIPYFLIPKDGSNTEFFIADTYYEALNNIPINLNSIGTGEHFVGKVFRKFLINNGTIIPDEFFEYETDKTIIKKLIPPEEVNGLQNMIDFVFGYSRRQRDIGFLVNNDKELTDPETGHPVEWELEIERFLEGLNGIRNQKLGVTERFEVSVDPFSNTWRFVGTRPQFATGTRVTLFTTGVIPEPMSKGVPYYIIRDTNDTFRVAVDYGNAVANNPITMVPTIGVGTLYLMSADATLSQYPRFEINPMRNGTWFKPDKGIVSNMITGPFETKKQLIFDQYGRPIEQKYINIFREDKLTKLAISNGIYNDVEPIEMAHGNKYAFIHMSGAQFFIDEYEHVLLFNYYTASGDMIYDPFLGVNISKFWLDFSKQPVSTGRPNVGGHYLRADGNLYPNFEKSIDDMRYYYDTFIQSETNERARQSRALLGYEGNKSYLDHINIRSKSQLIFYRGMIHHKGTTAAVKAFINSRKFEGASIDEFWAFKIAEFGSSFEKEYPQIYLKPEDARQNEIKLYFNNNPNVVANGYTQISLADKTRWATTPDNAATLYDEGSALYFTFKPTHVAKIDILGDTFGVTPFGLNYTTSGSIDFNGNYIRHNFKTDYVSISIDLPHSIINYTIPILNIETSDILGIQDFIPNIGMIKVFRNGILQVTGVDYYEVVVDGVLLSNQVSFVNPLLNDNLKIVYGTGELIPDVHFNSINSRIIKLNYSFPAGTGLTISGFTFDAGAQQPIKFIDNKSETTIENIQYWDPARKFFDNELLNSVDIISPEDPARYTDSTIKDIPKGASKNYNYGDNYWNKPEVGTVWVDDSRLDYVPYYDSTLYSDDEILKNWGRLSDYSVPVVYEWVESKLTPIEWDKISTQQSSQNIQLSDQKPVSGISKKILLKTDFIGNWYSYGTTLEKFDPVMDSIIGTNNKFMLTKIPKNILKITSFDLEENTVTVTNGYIDDVLLEGMTIRIVNGLNIGTYIVTTTTYDPIGSSTVINLETIIPYSNDDFANLSELGTIHVYPRVSVFVNGFLSDQDIQPEYTGELIISGIVNSDSITIGFFPNLTSNQIQLGIDNAVYSYEVQYSRVIEMLDSQTGIINNYFWVSGKKERDNNSLSAREVTSNLGVMNKPYVFFTGINSDTQDTGIGYDITPFGTIYEEGAGTSQTSIDKLVKAGKVDTFTSIVSSYNEFKLSNVPYKINRVCYVSINNIGSNGNGYDITPFGTIYEEGLGSSNNIGSNSNGIFLNPSDYSISEQKITILIPMSLGDKINIEYEYLISNIKKPVRFERLVLRGMRGKIFQDNRYIIQFVRDYTLRNNLESGSSQLELKNLHEEWTMIREKQLSNIPRYLWDKITESMIGYSLTNSNIRVPSLDRELYDLSYNSDTRFGLGDGMSFVPANMAMNNIITDLNRSDIDFSPINPGYFLESHNYLETNLDKISAMTDLFNTFGNVHVNRIFFSILHDSFASKIRYSDIFKTSWVALNGIRILETAGINND